MPTLRRLCESPGCGHLATRGSKYCEGHKAKAIARAAARRLEVSRQQPSPKQRGYDKAWKRLRDEFIQTNPYCAICGSPATQVDHKLAISKGGARLDRRNFQSLCRPCHAKKTIEENRSSNGHFGAVKWR